MKCIALLLMLTTVLAGCASSQVPAKPVSKLSPEVSQGTGFLVRSDGLVLTAFHVVETAVFDYATPLFDVPRGLSAPGDRPAARTPREVVEQVAQAVCIVLVGP